jgi:hypothetical protein
MAYASGKVTGYISNLGPILENTLRSVKKDPLVPDLLFTEQQISTDPFILRNQISGYDRYTDIADLGNKLATLTRNQFIFQIGSFSFWFLSLHFGVPLPVAIPIGLLSSSAGTLPLSNFTGMYWMKLRYDVIQKVFLKRISLSQNVLKDKLEDIQKASVLNATRPFRLILDKMKLGNQ